MRATEDLSLAAKIKCFLTLLPTITKAESDYIQDVLSWDDETKMAFIMAKGLFEDDGE
jgi:hypothetical protein